MSDLGREEFRKWWEDKSAGAVAIRHERSEDREAQSDRAPNREDWTPASAGVTEEEIVPRGTILAPTEIITKLDRYAEMLKEWNEKFNLVAASTLPDLWTRHFLDSAQLVEYLDREQGAGAAQLDSGLRRNDEREAGAVATCPELRVSGSEALTAQSDRAKTEKAITVACSESRTGCVEAEGRSAEGSRQTCRVLKIADMGSGAGFPGLILSIMTNHEIHLIESTGKKANFLRAVIEELGLSAIVHQERVEDIKGLKVDVVTARALKSLPELLAYANRLMNKDSFCLFLKGEKLDAELTEAAKCWKFAHNTFPSLSDRSGSVLIVRNLHYLQMGGSFAKRRPRHK